MATIRIPTREEMDQGYAQMEAEAAARAVAYRQAMQARGRPVPAKTVEVLSEPIPPVAPGPPPNPVASYAACPFEACGRIFDKANYKGNLQAALMARGKHVKRDHAGMSAMR